MNSVGSVSLPIKRSELKETIDTVTIALTMHQTLPKEIPISKQPIIRSDKPFRYKIPSHQIFNHEKCNHNLIRHSLDPNQSNELLPGWKYYDAITEKHNVGNESMPRELIENSASETIFKSSHRSSSVPKLYHVTYQSNPLQHSIRLNPEFSHEHRVKVLRTTVENNHGLKAQLSNLDVSILQR